MVYEKEKEVAIAATIAAVQLCQQVRGQKSSQTLRKADNSPVTVADFGSQAIITQELTEAFPHDSIIAEEDATLLTKPEFATVLTQVTHKVQQLLPQTSPQQVIDWINKGKGKVDSRYWTLDPIDGTKGFIRGDQYAIALALIEDGEVKLGVLACPALPFDDNGNQGSLFVAIRGQGSVMMSLPDRKSRRIKVNSGSALRQLCRIESIESNHSDRSGQILLDKALGWQQPPQAMDSQAKYGAVARGDADLYLRIPLPQFSHHQENIWDHAAGSIIVEEAQGCVTDLDGRPLNFSLSFKLTQNRGILVSNGAIHQQILDTIAGLKI